MRLLLWDRRIHEDTQKDISRQLMSILTGMIEFSLYTIQYMLEHKVLLRESRPEKVFNLEDEHWYIKEFPSYKYQPEPQFTTRFLNQKQSLRNLAEVIFISQRPNKDMKDLELNMSYASSTFGKQDMESIIGYLADRCPEIGYLLEASDDIGVDKAMCNLILNEAQVQCWLEDVWKQDQGVLIE